MRTFWQYTRSVAVVSMILLLTTSMAVADPDQGASSLSSEPTLSEPLVLAWNDRDRGHHHQKKCVRICRHRFHEAMRDCENERRQRHCIQRAKRHHENCLNRCDY
ncbi:MAG: hypothetical protein HQL99_07370 [Magnetococcales bacterium]|nr:hypothetical protein [Magnetococcales bacterium]